MITHLLSLSFDDGFRRSSLKTAEIYEKFGLQANLNVIASGHQPDFAPPDEYHQGYPRGNFALWDELQERGHEIMPHGFMHANKASLPLNQAQDLIERCLEVFSRELAGFTPERAVFAFPYNSSTSELEAWLSTRVRAFRTGGGGFNPLPSPALQRLTCDAYGPGNCEAHLERQIEALLAMPEGWLIYNNHGLDDEGWGPIRASFLERLLERLLKIETLRILPPGIALQGQWRELP